MLRKSNLLLGLASFVLLGISLPALSENSLSKEDWLKTFKALAPDAICQGIVSGEKTGAMLKEKNIDLEKCKPLITQSLNRCLDKLAAEMPSNIPESESKSLGEKLGRCSGEDFYHHYIAKP